MIQWNALRSWCALPDVQVVLVGDEAGVAAAAHEAGVEHVGGIAVSESGTRCSTTFARVESIARKPLRCFVNADIVFGEDLRLRPAGSRMPLPRFSSSARRSTCTLRAHRSRRRSRGAPAPTGRSRGATAIDYFIFSAGPVRADAGVRRRAGALRQLVVWRGRQHGTVVDASSRPRRSSASRLRAHRGGSARGTLRRRGASATSSSRWEAAPLHDPRRVAPAGSDLVCAITWAAMFRLRESLRKTAWKLVATLTCPGMRRRDPGAEPVLPPWSGGDGEPAGRSLRIARRGLRRDDRHGWLTATRSCRRTRS